MAGRGTNGPPENQDPDDGDLSAWDLPENFVFDENFIKGGVHEPPARTRESIAKYGGQRTSWRQGAILEPVSGKARRPRRRLRIVLTTIALLALIGGVGWYAVNQDGAPVIPSGGEQAAVIADDVDPSVPQGSEPPATTDTTEGHVEGINIYDEVGSCYFDPTSTYVIGMTVNLSLVDCTEPHNYELISHQSAAETADGSFPSDAYWQGPVSKTCEEAMTAYTGKPRSSWPTGLSSTRFQPRTDGWAKGDRNIFCLAYSTSYLTSSVKG